MTPRCAAGVVRDAGYTLVELLVAAACTLVVVGAVAALADPGVASSRRQPEEVDVQQRLRAGAGALAADLARAGAGPEAGAAAGPLIVRFPPVLPRRMGLRNADAPTVARADAVSVLSVPPTSVQSSLRDPFQLSGVVLDADPGCPPALVLCGLATGMGLVVFDKTGRFDAFTTTSVLGGRATLRHRAAAPAYAYPAGAWAAQIETRIYYYDAVARQLRQYDGDAADTPVIDDVTGLSVEYFGDPNPPRAPKPDVGEANCLYDAAGDPLPGLVALPATDGVLAALPLARFQDGPWCGAGDTRFDADLLRVRRVRVTLGVSSPGAVVSRAVTFDVAPRNLELRP
jgi:type II secretory pathway pseudopilin PulG